jgi:capsular polysaccharide transport system permease protein
MKEQLGVDLRQYYSKNDIDYWYRISPDMPLEKFSDYWSGMNEISFNSTTGNVTMYVFAFSADDAKAVADAVLKVSEKLVNDLSEKNRQQVTSVASKQVERSENRLRKIRDELSKLRKKVEIIDPKILVQSNAKLTEGLETQLQGLKTRQMALLESVSKDAPSARMLQKQINALQDQIVSQKGRIGKLGRTGDVPLTSDTNDANVAEVVDKFEGLTIDQDFATKAYTTSLGAFEAALSEAQKQDRYFATFVQPIRPEIALYPTRWLDTLVALLVLLAVWLISQFLYRSFRDHAI